MTKITSESTIKKVKNRLHHFGKVSLKIELTETNMLEIEENFSDKNIPNFSQGQIISIPKKGFEIWKEGIRKGIEYAYLKINKKNGLKVIIEKAEGLVTDTNPTILGFSACRAILEKLPNSESQYELEQLEKLVFSSWDYEYDAIPNFIEKTIIGKKLTTTRYKKL